MQSSTRKNVNDNDDVESKKIKLALILMPDFLDNKIWLFLWEEKKALFTYLPK